MANAPRTLDEGPATRSTRPLARWRLAFLLGRRDMAHHRFRTALVVTMVALATAIVGSTVVVVGRVLTPGGSMVLSSSPRPAAANVDDATVLMLTVVAALAVVQTLVLVTPAFLISLRRRTRELGLLAATGAPAEDLRRVVLGPAIVTAVVGVLIGAPLALVIGLGPPPPTPQELLVALVAVATVMVINVALCAVVAWLPARRVLRSSPVAALTARPEIAVMTSPRGVMWAAAGLLLLGAGVPLALAGAHGTIAAALVGGVVLAEGGLLTLVGIGLGALDRLPVRGVVAAYVLRDAARSRTRVLPAVAAGAIVVAGAVAGLSYSGTQHAQETARYRLVAPIGSALVTSTGGTLDIARVRAAAEILGSIRTVAGVRQGVSSEPYTVLEAGPAGPQAINTGGDWSMLTMAGPLVGDAELVTALGLPADAGAALDAGRVLVSSAAPLAEDGTIELRAAGRAVSVPATVEPEIERYSTVILSPEATEALGLTPGLVAAIVTPERPFTAADSDDVEAALGAAVVETGPPRFDEDPADYLTVGAGVLAVLLVTWAMSALAAQEARADLATLESVGAAPRTRRRIAASQAGLVAGTAAVCGVPAGLALGTVFLIAQRSQPVMSQEALTGTVVPLGPLLALLVGLPVLVALLGGLTTSTRTELAKRPE